MIFFSKKVPKEIRVILFYCVYTFLNDCTIVWANSSDLGFDLSSIVLSIFTVIEFLFFAYILFLTLKRNIFKVLISILAPLFIIFSTYLFIKAPPASIDAIPITVENILLIIICLCYFFEEINKPNTTFIYSSYTFWIVVGILIYSTGTFFLFMQANKLSEAEWEKYIPINHVFTSIKNIFFSVAIIINKRSKPIKNPPGIYDNLQNRSFS